MNAQRISIDAAREEEMQRGDVHRDRLAEDKGLWSEKEERYFFAECRAANCLAMLKYKMCVRRFWA